MPILVNFETGVYPCSPVSLGYSVLNKAKPFSRTVYRHIRLSVTENCETANSLEEK